MNKLNDDIKKNSFIYRNGTYKNKYNLKINKVDCASGHIGKQICKRFGIRQYPTIYLMQKSDR